MGRNGAGSDGVHANSAIAPLDSETASQGFDSGFRDRGWYNVGRAHRGIGSGDAEDGARMTGVEPAASAGHGGVQRAEQHNADHGFERARRKLFGARDEISGGVGDKNVEWS